MPRFSLPPPLAHDLERSCTSLSQGQCEPIIESDDMQRIVETLNEIDAEEAKRPAW